MIDILNYISVLAIVLAYSNIGTRRGTQLFLCSSVVFFFMFLLMKNYPQVLLNVFTGYMCLRALYSKEKLQNINGGV